MFYIPCIAVIASGPRSAPPRTPHPPISRSLGEFEQLLLFAILRLGDEAYGVTIRREIEERTGRAFSAGAVYTGLERLRARGMISAREGDATPERGGRRKKYYRVEPVGAASLHDSYENLRGISEGTLPRLRDLAGQATGFGEASAGGPSLKDPARKGG